MFRFIHSADWQLGARFSQFGAKAPRLREARLATLKRTLELAVKHEADAFLIAGDLFEDNQVDDSLVTTTVDLFRASPSLPIYILPGNHDPYTGRGEAVEPLPFHAMSTYPYPATERYPDDAGHAEYRARWNTRRVR